MLLHSLFSLIYFGFMQKDQLWVVTRYPGHKAHQIVMIKLI